MSRFRYLLRFLAVPLAACLLASGCATAALHGHMQSRLDIEALHRYRRGEAPVVAPTNVNIWDVTHWDVIREHWPLYLGAFLVDSVAAYYLYVGLRGDDGDKSAPPINNYYYGSTEPVDEPVDEPADAPTE
jgi:hypothetical protein